LRELRDIIAAFDRCCEAGERAVLATVVHVEGSTYRRRGARLLVLADDTMVGLISGGCLEGDLLEHAHRVRASGVPEWIHYDASREDDLVWGLGLGCAGVVDVWMERVEAAAPGPLAWIADWLGSGTRGALATAVEGPRAGALGAMVEGGSAEGALADPVVSASLERALEVGHGRTLASETERISIEVFAPPLRVVLFGAGPDAAPLARTCDALGWEVAVFDPRPAAARAERFPGATVRCAAIGDAVAAAAVDARTHCVVMNHHYLHDRVVLAALLATEAPYIAVLGPKDRTGLLLADLPDEGVRWREEDAHRLYAPAGLDLGADAPEAIALAIAAEIQAVSAGRSGGLLRERKGPIHDPEAD